MPRHWRMLLSIFTPRERVHIYLLLCSTTLLGLVQVAGITSIMPFIAVVVDSSVIDSNAQLNAIYRFFEFSSHREFLFFLGSLSFVMLILSNGFAAIDAWFTFRFCYLRRHDLCRRLLDNYLRRSYLLFLQRSTAELHKIVSTEVDRVIVGTLMAGIGLFSDVVAALFILSVLVWIDPWVTGTTLLVLGTAYGAIFATIQRRVSLLGEEFVGLGTEVVQRTREALDGAKEIKVLGREAVFVDRFARPHLRSSLNSIRHNTLDILPHQGLEVVAFGGVIAMTLYYLSTSEGSSEALAVISLYAFAAYRLIPTLKEIFDGIDTIRYNAPALEVVCADFPPGAPSAVELPGAPLGLARGIEVRGVRFQYPGARAHALDALDLSVDAGTMTCIMGRTGAGKSTAIDLVLGLLEPEQGEIRVDDTPIDRANVRRWQASIGYVPQVIYLIDDTIARNIALGVPDEEIDHERVIAAAARADLHGFVATELKEGYATVVGERGLRLSGGQRQRIGIARALYHDPPVLILDEATNALDRETESRVLQGLLDLAPRRTILFVSHRASVARRSDKIVVVSRGRVAAQGSYDDLASDPELRSLLVES